MKNHFNKNLIMSEKEEKQFQSSNICRISENLIDGDDEKVRDHCHWRCYITLQLTKKNSCNISQFKRL